jgi:LPXTG-site transpeptidase (sortase) family protein
MSRLAITSAVSGLLLLVGAPVTWQLSQPEETVGDVPVVVEQVEEAETEPRDEPAPEPVPEPEPAPEPDPVEKPGRLTIPAIDVDAPVVPVGLEDDGGMEIPHDISTIGWYEPGVMPGETGTAVLSGHVDSREQGRGAFWDLRTMDVDDLVTVDHEDGTTSEWRVTARTAYEKGELPVADIFTRFGDTRLVLITCGGAWDDTARHYEDNIVVYAEPVEDATSA